MDRGGCLRTGRAAALHGEAHAAARARAPSPWTGSGVCLFRRGEPGAASRVRGRAHRGLRAAVAPGRGPGPGSRDARRSPGSARPAAALRTPHSALRTRMSPTTFRVGRLTCHAIEGGTVRLDGVAMFGVVPKVLWQRRIPSDERNRIPLAMRCLLIEHPDGLVLVDTGLGNKENAKFKDIYGVDNEGRGGRTRLEDALETFGHEPADIAWVINSHLHFDHAGGNTYRGDGGGSDRPVRVSFPRAKYVVQKGELEFARRLNERTAASYLPPNFESISFATLSGEAEPLSGIRCIPTPGHTPGHQS